jgi:quercetin dioxygenase-like cupin family protein
MATHHATPGEIVDLLSWADDLTTEKNKAIAKTEHFELARLMLPAGKIMAEHQVPGPAIIHCIKGQVEIGCASSNKTLTSGQLLFLAPAAPHSVTALRDAIVVLTIIFKNQ